MKKYTFTDGKVITSKLDTKEIIKRMNRLDTLRVLMEGYDEGDGLNIYNKIIKAYNKVDNFTGIIRLTYTEKDFLGYQLEKEFLTNEDKEVIEFYTR